MPLLGSQRHDDDGGLAAALAASAAEAGLSPANGRQPASLDMSVADRDRTAPSSPTVAGAQPMNMAAGLPFMEIGGGRGIPADLVRRQEHASQVHFPAAPFSQEPTMGSGAFAD